MSHSRLTRDSLEGAAERPHMREERYVKQIVSDVMEMAAKIKFLEAKVAASESWSAECTDDHKRELAAALRRAKAEGLKEGAVYNCMYCNGNACCYERTVTGPNSAGNYLHRQVGHGDREVMCMSSSIWVLINWNARAAQIEEGE